MNYKHLLPTFRTRYLFTLNALEELAASYKISKGLNLGTGEGDYDAAIASKVESLIACDINAEDVQNAIKVNANVLNLQYEIQDALCTNYKSGTFDLIICTEVIEHVGDPYALLQEISRIVKPGGFVIMTFPISSFPITYDPINYLAQKWKVKMPFIRQGAYAFGHEYLIDKILFDQQIKQLGFSIIRKTHLSSYLIGLLEMYWTGWLQKIVKRNSDNKLKNKNQTQFNYLPKTNQVPKIALVTDQVIRLDGFMSAISKASVGLGLVLSKKETHEL